MRRSTPSWLTLLSAALIVPSFPPWDHSVLIWFSLVPWFLVIHRCKSGRDAFFQGMWLSFFMSLGGFYWIASVLHEFGNLPWALSVLGLLLFSLACQPQFLIFGPVFYWIQKKMKVSGLVFALGLAFLYTGIDWLSPKLFADTLGHSLYQAQYLRQAADLIGPIGLTFMIFFCNYTLWRLVYGIKTRSEPSVWPTLHSVFPHLATTAAILIAGWVYGHYRLAQIHKIMSETPQAVQGAVVQANIGDIDKLAAERGLRGARQKVLDTFFALSDRALAMTPKPEFLVWPETSYPSTFRKPETTDELARDQTVEHYVRDRNIPLLFGGYDHINGKDYNAFFFLNPKPEKELIKMGAPEGDLQAYYKNILLLFGEYIPGMESIPFLKQQFPQIGNFGRGIGPDVLKIFVANPAVSPVKTGPVICYEVLFPKYVIEASRKGSQMILNITNDSWFGPYGEPQLHLALTIFRTIENRLPMLRATNTGISALVLPDGEISNRTGIGVPEIMNVRIPILPPVWTLMKAWGDWFGWFSLLCGIGILGVLRRRQGVV